MSINLDSEPIVIVCAADDGYAMPLTVTIRSVLANTKSNRKIVVYIIDGGIRQGNKRKIIKSLNSDQVDLQWLQLSENEALLGKMRGSGHITVATYYRLLIPQFLPKQYKKVIYLDTDLIVKGDLEHLWNIDIDDKYVLAVQDMGIPYVSSSKGLKNYRELGIPKDYKYFNAGVLVMNLEKWRSDNIGTKVIEYIENNSQYVRWHDQDGLNAILAGKWGELDPKWNQTAEIHSYSSWKDSPLEKDIYNDVIHNSYIIHFTTAGKPWTYYSGCKHPEKDLFFYYLDMTAYSGWRLTIWRRLWKRAVRETKGILNFRKKFKNYQTTNS